MIKKVVTSGSLEPGAHENVVVEEKVIVNVAGAVTGETVVKNDAHLIVLGHLDGLLNIEKGGLVSVRGSLRLAGNSSIEGELRLGGTLQVSPHMSHMVLPKGNIYLNEHTVIQMGAVSYLLTPTGSYQALYGNQSFTVGEGWLKYDHHLRTFRRVNS